VLEALAAGTQVVCSDRTALPEVGGPFVTYFDPTLPDAATVLAELLDAALSTPKHNDPAALSEHMARFDWDLSAKRVIAAIAAAAQ
jgi:glycosyltransferase involved in cell wall biosynthesis